MSGPIARYLVDDHRRLDRLLTSALAGDAIDLPSYEAFRQGLLRHVGIEEKILLPAARRLRGEPLPIATQLRADHAALAALLVPTPTRAIVEQLRAVLTPHNVLEEEGGGAYAQCDELAAAEVDALVTRMTAAHEIPLAPHYDGERAFAGIERLLRAAGRVK